MDSCVRARNGAGGAGGPRIAFFLDGVVGSRRAHAKRGWERTVE
jgi:hypothetical protein